MVWERAWVRGTPPFPILGPETPKGNWNFCRKSSIGRYTGVQHCSAGPAQSTQKYPKIGQISEFVILLDKFRVGGPPLLFWGRRKQINRSFSAKNRFLLTF